MEDALANYLKMTKRQQVIALLALGWSFRKIERETGVRRETVSRYSRPADPNAAKVFPGESGLEGPESNLEAGKEGACWPGTCQSVGKTRRVGLSTPRSSARAPGLAAA